MLFSAVKICEEEDRREELISQTPTTENLSSPLQALLASSDSPQSISLAAPIAIASPSGFPVTSAAASVASAATTTTTTTTAAAAAVAGGIATTPTPSRCAEDERTDFLEKLSNYMTETGQNFAYIPIFDHKELDLWRLYKCVTARGGLQKVVDNKKWQEVIRDLGINKGRTDASYRLKTHYEKCLLPYEKAFFRASDEIPLLPSQPAPSRTRHHQQQQQQQQQQTMTIAAAANANANANVGLPQISVSPEASDSVGMSLAGKRKRSGGNRGNVGGGGGAEEEEGGAPDAKRMCEDFVRAWDDESLFRYAESFGLEIAEGDEMVSVVSDHFVNQKVDEEFVIAQFLDSINKIVN